MLREILASSIGAVLLSLSLAATATAGDVGITGARQTPAGFSVDLVGSTGQTYTVEARSGMTASWETVTADYVAATSSVTFVDATAPYRPQRFYRAHSHVPAVARTNVYHGWAGALTLSNSLVEVTVVPHIARIMQFRFQGEAGPFWENRSLDGRDPVQGTWMNFGGDKSWPSPQNDWGWPPPAAFDMLSHTGSVTGDEIAMVSPIDADYGIRQTRRIRLVPGQPRLIVTTTFEKVSGATVHAGIWTVTELGDPVRVFVPVPEPTSFANGWIVLAGAPPPDLASTNRLISFSRDTVASHKIGSDAASLLWVGAESCVRVDAFRIPGAPYPDSGCSAEVYTNPGDPYIELELLGPLHDLAIGGRTEFTVIYTLFHRTDPDPDTEARRILGL